MTSSRFPTAVAAALTILVSSANADVFYPIAGVETDTAATDLYPASNLIQGPGVGFDGDPNGFHDSLGGGPSGAWVTAAPAGFPSDYIEDVGMPVIILDLGTDVLLDEISVWGYSSGNSNGCSVFSLRFATAAEGKTGFGSSIAYNPTFTRDFPEATFRESFEFTEQVTARYVEFLCIDNFWDDQVTPGGDRVGLSEIAFRVASLTGGPNILIPGSLRLLNNGSAQTIEINVFNNGDAPLNISAITVGGADSASYTPGPIPGAIAPNASALATVSFDPAGITSDSTVSVDFASDDPDEPTKSVELTLAFPSFYDIDGVVSTADEDFAFQVDLWPSSNLIQGAGIGFDANPPHAKLLDGDVGNWVTAADAGFPSDYIEDVTQPILKLDLGEDVLLAEISVWGYSSGNANGVKDFSLRFATDADGPDGYGTTVTYNPVFNDVLVDPFVRQSFNFAAPVTARYVEFTCLDNFWDNQVFPGGDRVGLGEIAFEIPVVNDDATAEAPLAVNLALDGTTQTFTVDVRNAGAPDLVISSLSFSGTDADAFSEVALPAPIPTFTTDTASFQFDPSGLAGPVSAVLEINSNDPNSPTLVQLAGILHDPQIATVDPGTFGPYPSGSGPQPISILVGNIGATQTLNITDIAITGPSAANFTLVQPTPPSIPFSNSANIDLVFDPAGTEGSFAATLTISTDDPVNPSVSVPLLARVAVAEPLAAYWPLDDAPDSIDVVEVIAGNNGTSISNFLTFGVPGARPYSGTAADFDGIDNTIEVPYADALNPSSFTVVAWAYPRTNFSPHQSVITSRADGFPDLGGYVLYNAPSGNWEFWSGAGVGAGGWNSVSGGGVVLDEWVHLALVYDEVSNTKSIFVNGTQVGSTTVAITPNGADGLVASDLHIGSGSDFGDQFYFDGLIDEVAVFRTPLSAPEIQTIIDDGIAATYLGDPPVTSGDFTITAFSFDTITNQLAISFKNAPVGSPLILRRSFDLVNWQPVDDNVSTSPFTFTDTTIPAGTTEVYYRLDNLPE